ncbi:hypothetical protein [Rossellomorea marisflavi]|jgi:hypothetical protein|uniref:hypothetical protein n=1 Tax=Rossellomorea marisflavi TaxID=189381 RepID=UPI0015C4E2DB|nr:hypothetical protein [Rossellomorea marisflavi]
MIRYNGFVIALKPCGHYDIYSQDEWDYGPGLRYPEHEAGTIQEAKDFIDSY